ncbi:uncharacterized protein [Haliotis cracherodii]|uniref:uncharacterized protein n=1 Tax=Haliotis cracherodii TaxID=6455 RepID=UPI0039E90254
MLQMMSITVLGLLLVVLDARRHSNITTETFLLPESVMQSVKDEPDPRQAVCRYLCSRGPVTAQVCRCSLWLPCLGKVCRQGTSCRIRGQKSIPQTLCCPNFSDKMEKQCEKMRTFLTYRRTNPYYKYNPSTGGCEIRHVTASKIQLVTVPGYKNSHACALCSLYKMCAGPVVEQLVPDITSYGIQ